MGQATLEHPDSPATQQAVVAGSYTPATVTTDQVDGSAPCPTPVG